MLDFLRWITLKHDNPPGTLLYTGTPRDFTPHATCLSYGVDGFSEAPLLPGLPEIVEGRVNFITVVGIHDEETVRQIGVDLDFPALALEDVMNTSQRAKFTWVDDETAFVVARDLYLEDGLLAGEQVSMFWRNDLVVVFLETDNALLEGVFARIKKGKGRIRGMGGSYLACAVLDALVDSQMVTLAHISESAETLETQLVRRTTDDLLGQLYELKRETILLRNHLTPMREIFKAFQREDTEIPAPVLPYLRDTAGHLEQAVEGVTALHDILKSMIDYQISLIGMQTNRVMQFLTVIATIFIPLTFIAGVYGMNFQYMPELSWRYGYFATLAGMTVIGVAMLIYFIRRRFL